MNSRRVHYYTPEVVLRPEEFTATTALRSGPSVQNTHYGSFVRHTHLGGWDSCAQSASERSVQYYEVIGIIKVLEGIYECRAFTNMIV